MTCRLFACITNLNLQNQQLQHADLCVLLTSLLKQRNGLVIAYIIAEAEEWAGL